MRIRFLKDLDLDVDKTNLREVWPKYIRKYEEYEVYQIETITSKNVNVVLNNDDVLLEVPSDSFEYVFKKMSLI